MNFQSMNPGFWFILFICLSACHSNSGDKKKTIETVEDSQSSIVDVNSNKALENYKLAKTNYEQNPDNPDALIWYARREAYLGNYKEAIDLYSKGIQLHPNDARIYRHRGHRYISTRQYQKAIIDFEQAVLLIEGQEDQVEPDGLPNSRNLPLTTLHGNIWYHLGLAYYLINDLDNAARAFSNRTVTEAYDDNVVSGGHWLYMIYSRQGKTQEAEAAISRVHPNMDIIENESYYKMCLFYKGLMEKSELVMDDPKSSSANVFNYGLGNWYLYHDQDSTTSKAYYKDLLDHGNRYSFAYLAAESDWKRLFRDN